MRIPFAWKALKEKSATREFRALREEHRVARAIIVSLEKEPRRLEPGLQVLPWQDFLKRLWAGSKQPVKNKVYLIS